MGSSRWIVAAVLAVVSCRGSDQPNEARVTIESELVEQVCRGTVVHAESELARIEAELQLGRMAEQVEVHVVDPERIGEYCPEGKTLCVVQPPRRIYVSAELYGRVITRELVRDRLARSIVGSTKPMFSEGVATALTRPMCTARPEWDPPAPDGLLKKTLGTSLSEGELYLAGELLRWLLDTHGPEVVLEFMATLDRSDRPNEVRLAYLERFGSPLDTDLYAHWRPADEEVSPDRVGCVGVEVERDPTRPRVRLEASFDCDNPRVRNVFQDPSRVFVEWILTIDETNSGRYLLDGPLPAGVSLEAHRCECEWASWTEFPAGGYYSSINFEDGTHLRPGTYRVRAYGPIGSTLDYELIAPCDYHAQNCEPGQQCFLGGSCLEQVPDPGQLDEPCEPAFSEGHAPQPCDAGLRCVGPVEQPGVCMSMCGAQAGDCPADMVCEGDFCARPCDPLAQDCDEGWRCMPNFETGTGVCIPSDDLGVLDSCTAFSVFCGPGLWCESILGIPGCFNPDPDVWFDFTGCCTPICDPAAAEPGCPPELPNCEAAKGGPLGTCRP